MEYFKLIILFTILGCFCENVFTCIYDSVVNYYHYGWKGIDKRLFGKWSLNYAIGYSICAPIIWSFFVILYIYPLPLFIKAIVYGFIFQIGEYFTMFILDKVFGIKYNHYINCKWEINNYTRLDFFPFFMIMGLVFEFVHKLFLY